ncbi:MAG: alpha/beta hydrolase [Gemmatimonadota bacterium]
MIPGSRESVRRDRFRIDVAGGDVLRGDAWIPEAPRPDASIVVCHGFKGFKDWGFFPHLSEALARRTGFLTICFNFSGSGIGERPTEFDELEAFGRNTFTRELFDLEIVLDGLATGRLGELSVLPSRRFGLLGHSRGGATCVLKAASRRAVRALVTWAGIAAVDRYVLAYAPAWEAGEEVSIVNARTGQRMPLYRNVLDDIRANRERLDVEASARALSIPYLVVHGTADESVSPDDARTLAEAAGASATLLLIEEAGHTMNAGHPFQGPNPCLTRAIEASADHFSAGLEGQRA